MKIVQLFCLLIPTISTPMDKTIVRLVPYIATGSALFFCGYKYGFNVGSEREKTWLRFKTGYTGRNDERLYCKRIYPSSNFEPVDIYRNLYISTIIKPTIKETEDDDWPAPDPAIDPG